MADEMLKAAQAEVQRLEALLATTDEYKKLQLAKQVVAMYSAAPDAPGGAAKQTARPFQENASQHETKRAQIDRLASEFLRARSRRAKVSEIWPYLESAGVELGDEPMKALSAYLSKSNVFDNDAAKGGYGLVDWSNRSDTPLPLRAGNGVVHG